MGQIDVIDRLPHVRVVGIETGSLAAGLDALRSARRQTERVAREPIRPGLLIDARVAGRREAEAGHLYQPGLVA